MSEQAEPVPTRPDPGEMEPDSTFGDLWPWIREKFPPARAVAFLSPFAITLSALVTTWVVNHLPFIAEQVNGEWVAATFLFLLASGVGLAYKWLDGRAKWEGAQVSAAVDLLTTGKLEAAQAEGIIEEPKPKRRRHRG